MPGSNDALSLFELTTAVGLGDIFGTVTQDVPLIKEILDTMRVRTVSAVISYTVNGWAFFDWSVEVELANFNVIPRKVLLRDVIILLQKTMIVQEISAFPTNNINFSVPTVDVGDLVLSRTTVLMDLRIPTKSIGEEMWLKIPNGVSL